jgi:HlyD family secretion protein
MYGDADPRATTLSVVVLMSAAFLACSQGAANETTDDLQTATVARQTIVSSVDATGTIEPIRIIEVKSQAGGEILELPVELGDYVEQGTLLARIDPRDVRNSFEQAQADLYRTPRPSSTSLPCRARAPAPAVAPHPAS